MPCRPSRHSYRSSLQARAMLGPALALIAIVLVAWGSKFTSDVADQYETHLAAAQAASNELVGAHERATHAFAHLYSELFRLPPDAPPETLLDVVAETRSELKGAKLTTDPNAPMVDEINRELRSLIDDLDGIAATAVMSTAAALDLAPDLLHVFERLHECYERAGFYMEQHRRRLTADLVRSNRNARWREAVVLTVAAAIVVGFGTILRSSLLAPIERVHARTIELAAGDLDTPIPCHERRDEVGQLARALEVFRGTARRLHHSAYIDPLTSLANRGRLLDVLGHAVARNERGGGPFALLMLDLDRFKEVNDSLGHEAGDQLLCEASTRLTSLVRRNDTVARLGGDEFAIVLDQCPTADAAATAATSVLSALEAPFAIAGQQVGIGVSVGIARCPVDGLDASELMRHADLALYEAKRLSRQTFRAFEPRMSAAVARRRSIELDFRQALDNDAITFVYQPKVRLIDGKIVGAETLARWRRNGDETVPPSDFVPIAEQTGLISRLGEHAIRAACVAGRCWYDLCDGSFKIAVNMSVAQLKRGEIPTEVERALAAAGLPPHALAIEITESLFLDDDDTLLRRLAQLGELGVALALDDFGTGYASLGYLRRFAFQELKIDRTFVHDLDSCADARALARGIVELGHALDMQVTAEGIETEAQRRLLVQAGCVDGQGHLFGRPMEACELTAAIESQRAALSVFEPALSL